MGFKIIGEVVGGKRLGRELGFPTANIILDDTPETGKVEDGVYAAFAIVCGRTYEGMANVGRDRFGEPEGKEDTPPARVLEINIFGFEEDIYGERIEVELLYKIRDGKEFASSEELRQAVDDDRRIIEDYFRNNRK